MKRIFILIQAVVLFSCGSRQQRVVQAEDLGFFFLDSSNSNPGLHAIEKELDFWSPRIHQNELVAAAQLSKLFEHRFKLSADIRDLHRADSFAVVANRFLRKESASGFRAMAAVAISRHDFAQAETYLDSAYQLGDEKQKTLLMQFDVAMERGNELLAKTIISSFAGNESFEVLIRKAKWADQGEMNLDKSIDLMEKALSVLDTTDRHLYHWGLSMLGDMYGHAGRFRESYNAYLKVLRADPSYFHCAKGIAWLAFSHDRDPLQARSILVWIKRKFDSPDLDLLLADISTFEKDHHGTSEHLAAFNEKLERDSLWKKMYRSHLFDLATTKGQWEDAFKIARAEVKDRPSARSYSLLAYVYAMKGEFLKAKTLVMEQIEGRSAEPDVELRLGYIFDAIGNREKASLFFNRAEKAWFELGPNKQRLTNINL